MGISTLSGDLWEAGTIDLRVLDPQEVPTHDVSEAKPDNLTLFRRIEVTDQTRHERLLARVVEGLRANEYCIEPTSAGTFLYAKDRRGTTHITMLTDSNEPWLLAPADTDRILSEQGIMKKGQLKGNAAYMGHDCYEGLSQMPELALHLAKILQYRLESPEEADAARQSMRAELTGALKDDFYANPFNKRKKYGVIVNLDWRSVALHNNLVEDHRRNGLSRPVLVAYNPRGLMKPVQLHHGDALPDDYKAEQQNVRVA